MSGMRAAAAIVALVSTVTHLAGAAETKALDLAAIVSKTDAASALGEPVKDPQSRNDEATDGYYSRCNYYSQNPGRSLVLRLRQAGAGQLEPAKQLDELMAGNVKIKPLARSPASEKKPRSRVKARRTVSPISSCFMS
jgi:hypothetical protein